MFLVRHGQTEWSRTRRHTGRTDVELESAGRAQAESLSALLADRSFSQVLTSPLARAAETCQLAGFGEVAVPDEDLAEWDYGEYDGLTSAQIRERRPGWNLWVDGVPGGETPAAVGARADRVIARSAQSDGDTLCFSHGHLLRVLAARWVGLPPVGGRLLLLGTGSLSVLGWEAATPVIARWNQLPPAAPPRPG